jgi:CRP/FNR family transcriptional regulator
LDFRRVASETPAIALAVLDDFSAKLRHLADLTHDLSLRSVRGRLARFLLAQAQVEDAPLRWTQEEIAAQIGTVREVVSRMLRALIRDGLIQMERQRIAILDPEALEAEAEA